MDNFFENTKKNMEKKCCEYVNQSRWSLIDMTSELEKLTSKIINDNIKDEIRGLTMEEYMTIEFIRLQTQRISYDAIVDDIKLLDQIENIKNEELKDGLKRSINDFINRYFG